MPETLEPAADHAALASASWASSDAIRRTMQGNRRRDTAPEMKVRRLLHAQGVRYRVDVPLPFDRRRRADLVFRKQKLAVFIDGCFWHGCPVHYVEPRTNRSYWKDKVSRNVARDRDTDVRMQELGWRVMRFWEHQATADVVGSIRSVLTTSDCT